MSIEHARSFYNEVCRDHLLNDQIRLIESREERLRFAQTRGYQFTPEQWKRVLSENESNDKRRWHGAVGRSGCTFPNECK